jgi:hypothetical protein
MFTNYIATFGKQFIVKSVIYRIVAGRVVVFNATFNNNVTVPMFPAFTFGLYPVLLLTMLPYYLNTS